MSNPKQDANCIKCEYRRNCTKGLNSQHDKNGRPDVNCYAYKNNYENEPKQKTNKSPLFNIFNSLGM